jgi:hypothetical protein
MLEPRNGLVYVPFADLREAGLAKLFGLFARGSCDLRLSDADCKRKTRAPK